jgi:hypothetical protein
VSEAGWRGVSLFWAWITVPVRASMTKAAKGAAQAPSGASSAITKSTALIGRGTPLRITCPSAAPGGG